MRSLTTTSYALLGLLALRPWSAYELTGFMRTSAIRRYWPRTQSRLYSEPKNLAAHGLVKATREHNGRRRRTVYRVTAKGRRALGRWLGLPPAHVQTWDEAMLKLMLVDLGTREQALATIRAALEHLVGDARYVLEFAGRVAHARGRFPERRHISALSARELTGSMRARLDYLRW
ncbi:MAG TPA: helix-turn-helix transcriptional regulator, partial [Vicinamibacterales bacterium]|nr:helix-turn-helix transcriptional regulator [Vicinamibacterales bacterium]